MLQAFIVTLREGLEAFLIVAISLALLRKSGRHQLVPAVRWGIAASIALSVGAALLFSARPTRRCGKGCSRIVAAVLVASLIVHMWRHAKTIKRDIEHHLAASAAQVGFKAALGVFLFTLLMITREGMETALLLGTLFSRAWPATSSRSRARDGGAAFVAYLWSRYGHRVNLALFFQVTAVFLAVFVVQLFIYGFHELAEANLWPNSQALHDATEPYGPDGVYGQYLSYSLVVLPMAWLAVSAIVGRKPSTPAQQPATR
jgi:high-affinity iron transporter